MSEYISTGTVILVSLLCRKMPGLFKCISQYSTPSKKKNAPSPISLLSAEQIQEARQHPSSIVQQALKAVAVVQGSLNASTSKLDILAQQRSNIEKTLTKLISLSKKETTES